MARRIRLQSAVGVLLLLISAGMVPTSANAQSQGSLPTESQVGTVDVKASIGYTGFFDDDGDHFQTGGSARFYATHGFSFEPEVQYLRASAHDDFVLVANVNWDLLEGRVVPYLAGGVGYRRGRFTRSSANDFFAHGGLGAKVNLNDTWFFSPDFRFGYYFHVRTSVGFGYSFRR